MLVNVFQNKSVYKVPIILKDEKFNFPFKNQQTLIIINKATGYFWEIMRIKISINKNHKNYQKSFYYLALNYKHYL